MASAIVAVGDELVGGFVADTNSAWLAERLRVAGLPVKRIAAVRDRPEEIVEELRRDLADGEVDAVFCCGGLGPTPDDRTFAAVASALGRELVLYDEVRARIARRVALLHEAGLVESAEPTEGNLRMARIPSGPDVVFRNRRGMAPGVLYLVDGKRLFVLPGVPHELRSILTEEIEPQHLGGGRASEVRELRFRFALESRFYPLLRELEESHPDVAVGSYPRAESRELVIRVSGADAERVEEVARTVARRARAEQLGEEA